MTDLILELSNISKKFCNKNSTSIYYGLKDIFNSFFGININSALRKDEFWAVKDVSLTLRKGQCLGIVGVNGSGKSTLMKLISELLIPDKGNVQVNGRVCSLLEVSSGFHSQLTGRENIFIRGQILGLSNQEINKQLESIIDFSGVESFIDSPVKSYSSGMKARLGFAIAAHVNADLLILDEVLAVGDMSFRAKCLQYLDSIKAETAIILVSHNMQIISRICDEAYLLRNGKIIQKGAPDKVLEDYAKSVSNSQIKSSHYMSDHINICELNLVSEVTINSDFKIDLHLETSTHVEVIVNISIHRDDGVQCFGLLSDPLSCEINESKNVSLNLSSLSLMPAEYYVNVIVFEQGMITKLAIINHGSKFRVNGDFKTRGVFEPDFNWSYNDL